MFNFMKKVTFILLLAVFNIQLSFAQTQDDLQREMDILLEDLEQSMKQVEQFFNEKMMKKLDFSQLEIDLEKLEKQFGEKGLDKINSEKLEEIMRQQMEILKNIDFSQFSEFFENLEIPAPKNNSGENNGENESKTPSKKKRKTYKM